MAAMRALLVATTGCLLMEASGQTAFNRRYDAFDLLLGDFAWSIEPTPDGNYLVFANGDWIYEQNDTMWYTSSALRTLKIAPNGEELDLVLLYDTTNAIYPGFANSAGRTPDGRFYLGGSNFQPGDIQAPIIFLFHQDGELDTNYIYQIDNDEWIGRCCRMTKDNSFLLCGETGSVGTVDAFLIKTDSLGNELWRRTYGGPMIDVSTSVDTVGSGFYLGGQYRSPPDDKQLWVQRLDSAGNVIWETIWGGPHSEPNAQLTTLANGNAFVASGYGYSTFPNRIRCYQAELDSSDGSIVWEQEYGIDVFNTTLFTGKEISPGGDRIAVGQSYEPGYPAGVLLRSGPTGDSLWMRFYAYADSLWTTGHGWLRDVVPTPDGGFMAVGSALGTSANPDDPNIYSQDIWVIKVDSIGCIEPGCHLITDLQSQVTNLRGVLNVAPNPASEQARITWDLPPNKVGSAQLSVVSASSGLVSTVPITLGGESYTLDVSGYAAGLYHLHLVVDGQWVSGAKLVVE